MNKQDMVQNNCKHRWAANDTLSVFTCSKCGLIGFAPHPLPEMGYNG